MNVKNYYLANYTLSLLGWSIFNDDRNTLALGPSFHLGLYFSRSSLLEAPLMPDPFS